MEAMSPALLTIVRNYLTLLRRSPSSAERGPIYTRLADVLHSQNALEPTVHWLAQVDTASRKLLLELVAVWPAPLPASLAPLVSTVLVEGDFRSSLHARAIESLLRRGALSAAELADFLARSGPDRVEEVAARLKRLCADLPEVRAVIKAVRQRGRSPAVSDAEVVPLGRASPVPAVSPDDRHTACPKCGKLAFVELEPSPPLSIRREHHRSFRLEAGKIEIELEERLLRPHLSIRMDGGIVFDGAEPGRGWSRAAFVFATCLPLCVLALVASALLPAGAMSLVPTSILLGVAVWLWVRRWLAIPARNSLPERFGGYVWSRMIPALLTRPMSPDDFAFVYCAVQSLPSPTESQRETIRTLRVAGLHLVRTESLAWSWLEPLWHAELADDGTPRDALVPLAELLAASWTGELSPYAGERLAARYASIYRGLAERVRLRILTLDGMFAAGLEVRDIVQLGREYEGVGGIVGSGDPPGLARLRWLRQLQSLAPWKSIGRAASAFELARMRPDDRRWLTQRPDLLLLHSFASNLGGVESTESISICEAGVFYRDLLIDTPRMTIRTVSGAWQKGEGAELRIGPVSWRFPEEPRLLADTLRRWVAYLFEDFRPMADAQQSRPHSRGHVDRRDAERSTCEFCGTEFEGSAGRVGRAL